MTKLVCQNNISSIFIVQFKTLKYLTISFRQTNWTAGWLILGGRLRQSRFQDIKDVKFSEFVVIWYSCYYTHTSHCPLTSVIQPESPSPVSVISVFSSLCLDAKWCGVMLKLSMFYITYYIHWHSHITNYQKLEQTIIVKITKPQESVIQQKRETFK